MLEIVAGIGDDGQLAGRQHAAEAERQLGAADPARQRHHDRVVLWRHRNRILGSRAPPGAPARRRVASGADQVRPRTRTTGVASSACPITSEAAAAISSAKPGFGDLAASRPNRSGWPRQSISAGRPAAPIATPTVPRRQARPKLSLMITAMRHAEPCVRRFAQRRGRAVGIDRQQQHRARCRRRARHSTGRCRHWPSRSRAGARRSARSARCRTTRARFRQDHLDQARILVDLGGEFDGLPPRARRSRDRPCVLRPSRRSSAPRTSTSPSAGASPLAHQRGDRDGGEIVARLHQRHA